MVPVLSRAFSIFVAVLCLVSALPAQEILREQTVFSVVIDGRRYYLEVMLYRPNDSARHPLVVFSHGRNGPASPLDPLLVFAYAPLCEALTREGHVVAYVVRRGYGYSQGPDSEFQDTAVLSGLEGAKDYAAAVAYWRRQDYVLPDKVLLMGQSQGGWIVVAGTTVPMEGVLGAVNISGGINYRQMGTGSVADHWVEGCAQLGREARIPSLWIHSENDLSIPGATARRMFDAFTQNGGEAELQMLPPFSNNGHAIVAEPSLFMGKMKEFFRRIGFVGPPVVRVVARPADVVAGTTVELTAVRGGNPAPDLQWHKNGVELANGGAVSGAFGATLRIENFRWEDAGLYSAAATSDDTTTTSEPVLVGVQSTDKVSGEAREVASDIHVASNARTYDQVLLAGRAAAVKADFSSDPAQDQITRVSFLDLDDDIVQVEYSGPGTLSLVLQNDPGPAAAPAKYQQEVNYVKGHVGIVITGANEYSNITVFSVGRATASNQALFRESVTYGGMADIAFIAIASANGKFGGVRTANASYYATRGWTGVYAPGVSFDGPLYIGQIDAFDAATPVIQVGGVSDVRIAGGDLWQTNGRPVQVSGMAQLKFTAGMDSHGNSLVAQSNRAVLQRDGRVVTDEIAVNPP